VAVGKVEDAEDFVTASDYAEVDELRKLT